MKQVLLGLLLSFSVNAIAADSHEEADKLFNQRDFTADGVKSALAAAEMYSRLASSAKDGEKSVLNIGASKAFYFVGTAAKEKADKISNFEKGMAAASQVISKYIDMIKVEDADLKKIATEILGKHSASEVEQIALGLYHQGINLGSWAEANGVMQSLSKWPELRNYMVTILELGQKIVGNYGADRVLGRAYYKLPTIAGGDMEKAGKHLGEAFKNTQVSDGVSKSGATNVFYAEYLHKEEKEAEAIANLKKFVAMDPAQVDPDSVPETKAFQQAAKALLDRWEE